MAVTRTKTPTAASTRSRRPPTPPSSNAAFTANRRLHCDRRLHHDVSSSHYHRTGTSRTVKPGAPIGLKYAAAQEITGAGQAAPIAQMACRCTGGQQFRWRGQEMDLSRQRALRRATHRPLADANSIGTVQGEPTSGVMLREWGEPELPGVLLWPGLGSTGAYFAGIAGALPGRAVAADPPGFGSSAPLEPSTFERLVDVARRPLASGDARPWSATRWVLTSRWASAANPLTGCGQ